MKMWKIAGVEPLDPGFIRLTWDDGVTRDVDICDWMTKRPLLEMLQIPEVFRDVAIINGGTGIEWVNGVDFCAQALRLRSDEQVENAAGLDA